MSKKNKHKKHPYRKLSRKRLERECEVLAEISGKALFLLMQQEQLICRAEDLVEDCLEQLKT